MERALETERERLQESLERLRRLARAHPDEERLDEAGLAVDDALALLGLILEGRETPYGRTAAA